MRVGRQNDARIGGGPTHKSPLDVLQPRRHRVDFVTDPQTDIVRNLIVAAAPGVEFAANVADSLGERPLDVHMDVFQLLAELEPARGNLLGNLLEASDDLAPLVVSQDADL